MINKQYFVNISSQEIIFKGVILFEQHNTYIILNEINDNLDKLDKLIYYLISQIKRFCIQYSERNPHKIMEYAKKEIDRFQKTYGSQDLSQIKNQIMFISMDNFITLRVLSEEEFNRFKKVDKIIKEIII